jgi:hypothetical protein
MIDITTLTQLRGFVKTKEAFGDEFQYKGFRIWWSVKDVNSVQTRMDGHFKCDPITDAQYKHFNTLNKKRIGNFEWFLSL